MEAGSGGRRGAELVWYCCRWSLPRVGDQSGPILSGKKKKITKRKCQGKQLGSSVVITRRQGSTYRAVLLFGWHMHANKLMRWFSRVVEFFSCYQTKLEKWVYWQIAQERLSHQQVNTASLPPLSLPHPSGGMDGKDETWPSFVKTQRHRISNHLWFYICLPFTSFIHTHYHYYLSLRSAQRRQWWSWPAISGIPTVAAPYCVISQKKKRIMSGLAIRKADLHISIVLCPPSVASQDSKQEWSRGVALLTVAAFKR